MPAGIVASRDGHAHDVISVRTDIRNTIKVTARSIVLSVYLSMRAPESKHTCVSLPWECGRRGWEWKQRPRAYSSALELIAARHLDQLPQRVRIWTALYSTIGER